MRNKDQVSSGYLNDIKFAYRSAANVKPSNRKALVIGAAPDNIGDAIADHLRRTYGFTTSTPSEKELDVRDPSEQLDAWMRAAQPDVLVLSQGVTDLDWFEDQSEEKQMEIINVNLLGSIRVAQSFVRMTLLDSWHKHIVFIGSMAYDRVLNGSAVYCASKAGLAHFARCLGWELTPKGYTVNIVHPSNVEGTPMTEATIQGLMEYRSLDREEAEEYWGAVNLKQRWLAAEDIANVVGLLVSSNSMSWTSGTNIELTGGQR